MLYDRQGVNAYRNTFRIHSGNGFDMVSETDGIEAVAGNFGLRFPEGLFIAMDDKDADYGRNFKLVSCRDILAGLAE